MLIQLPFPGSKVFSLVVLIKRERATRMPDSFFPFSVFSVKLATCKVCEIFQFVIDDRSFILSSMNRYDYDYIVRYLEVKKYVRIN